MVKLLIAVVMGVMFGRTFNFIVPEWLFSTLLIALVFLAGISVGNEEELFRKIQKRTLTILIMSSLTIAGSLFGGFLASFLTDLSIKEAVGASAGLGWYSLSAIMISKVYSQSLGLISFAANIIRELLSIVIVPLLSKVTRYGAISCAGATSMDTLLGVISEYSTSSETLVAFGHGVILTVMVPVLITVVFY